MLRLVIEAPEDGVLIEFFDIGIFEAFAGTDGGDKGATVGVVVDGPDEWMRAAAEAGFVFGGEDFGVVVGADVFEGGGLAAVEGLADHKWGAVDA